ncbi:hypothetical protein [Cryobacterium sp. SO1]|uniref:hypothetical protein n=1 Tax=Cryobacterium sp. SO1 TaxID=1897061 RepID=UPI001022D3AB|nr:hypothetical protein [Cryobacterium sp. SO1]RZI36377.1 hypothetical protein BJQ95_01168 [Cryobacterium sp. SO1]
MSVSAVEIAWSSRLGGGWETWCDECGSVWADCTQDELELDRLQQCAEEAAPLHEDNDHARVILDEGTLTITTKKGTSR